MNMMQIYDKLPVFLQNAAVSLEGYRIQKHDMIQFLTKYFKNL